MSLVRAIIENHEDTIESSANELLGKHSSRLRLEHTYIVSRETRLVPKADNNGEESSCVDKGSSAGRVYTKQSTVFSLIESDLPHKRTPLERIEKKTGMPFNRRKYGNRKWHSFRPRGLLTCTVSQQNYNLLRDITANIFMQKLIVHSLSLGYSFLLRRQYCKQHQFKDTRAKKIFSLCF